jgi:hypothetical protein
MNGLGQIRPTSIGRFAESRWFPIAVTLLAILSAGAEIWGILRGLASLVGR